MQLPYKPSASSHPSQAAMADKVPKSATLAYPSASGQSRFVPSSGAREAPRVAAQAPQNSCQNYDERPLSHTRAAPPPALVTPPRPAPQVLASPPALEVAWLARVHSVRGKRTALVSIS